MLAGQQLAVDPLTLAGLIGAIIFIPLLGANLTQRLLPGLARRTIDGRGDQLRWYPVVCSGVLLATFLHAGVGGSRDVVAAKAVMHLAQVVGGELVRQHPDIWPQYQPTPDEHLPVQILRNQINDNLRGMPELLARRGETPAASG